MLWKCSLTVLVGEGADADVVTEDRVATDPRLGLEMLWRRVQEQLSLIQLPVRASDSSFQVLGWCDPIVNPQRWDDAHQQQRLVDRARYRDEELELARLVAAEPGSLDSATAVDTDRKEGQRNDF